MPVDAIAAVGPEWNIAMPEAPMGVEGADAVQETGSGGFGDMLAGQIQGLQGMQTDAAAQSQALATGAAEDASTVVMAVEKAQLSMQLAATLRDKGLEAFQEVFRTQV
jgi:flagellar hook-basal body complex protein FliE